MKKLSESIWGDFRKKSLGQEERLEDKTNIQDLMPVDLGGSILWADRDLEQQGKDKFTYKEVQELILKTEWRLPTAEEAKELERPGHYEDNGFSFSEGDQKLEFTKRKYTDKDPGNTYVGWTSDVAAKNTSTNTNRMCVFCLEDSRTTESIILMAEEDKPYSARLVKDLPRTNESVWGNIRKKSLGQEIRKEDDIEHLDRDGLYDLIIYKYELKPNYKTAQIKKSQTTSNDKHISLPIFAATGTTVYRMSIAFDNKIKSIYIQLHITVCKQWCSSLFDKFLIVENGTGNGIYIYSKNETVTNKLCMDVIETIVNDSERSALQKREN